MGLQALIPQFGLQAANQTQFLKRSQELLHAITRQPLAMGFGMGGRDFGWVLGPKFVIEDGSAAFLHSPVRHDVAVSIVVPGWWDRVRLQGRYNWIDVWGQTMKEGGGDLWKDGIEVTLPRPNDPMMSITTALFEYGGGDPGDPSFRLLTRPPPQVDLPSKGDSKSIRLQAGQNRTLLILGKHVWRNPQVFLGSQKASSVEVLSDMEGILAGFAQLEYPGLEGKDGVAVDLHLVTSYGADHIDSAVTILPAPVPVPAPPPATVPVPGNGPPGGPPK
jgi:hypothetical protein